MFLALTRGKHEMCEKVSKCLRNAVRLLYVGRSNHQNKAKPSLSFVRYILFVTVC